VELLQRVGFTAGEKRKSKNSGWLKLGFSKNYWLSSKKVRAFSIKDHKTEF